MGGDPEAPSTAVVDESADTAVRVGEGAEAGESRGLGVMGVEDGSSAGGGVDEEGDADEAGDGVVGTMEVEGSSLGRKTELMSPMPTKKSSRSEMCISFSYKMR